MKLVSCYIAGFGKWRNQSFDLGKDVVEIKAENGFGKTTLLNFLECMLFGMDAGRGKAVEDNLRGKYLPFDGGVYGGEVVKGIKSGFGKYTYPNGDSYEGEFAGDLRHGEGKYVWANGETYTGEFASGNMHGFGTYTWPEGRPSYTGYFKDGKIVVVDD